LNKQLAVYLILLLVFIVGSIYNFRIRKQCVYSIKLTKSRLIILIIIPLIFLSIAYYIGRNSWNNYILAISAGIFVISAGVGEGIHERGIYYHPPGIILLAKLAKWEDIRDSELDINKNKLKSFKIKTTTMFADQYYSKDINEINEYIKIKTKKN